MNNKNKYIYMGIAYIIVICAMIHIYNEKIEELKRDRDNWLNIAQAEILRCEVRK